MFDELYYTEELQSLFGENWCGPDKLEHSKETLIATYISDDDSDGMDVEVYCTMMPATFFTVKVLPTANSLGEVKGGFSLSTGSGQDTMGFWAKLTAEHVCSGMIGLNIKEEDNV